MPPQQPQQSQDGWDDDDVPPPLSSLPDQLHAAQLSGSLVGTAGLVDGELRHAATTNIAAGAGLPPPLGRSAAPVAVKQPLRRGFLDAKRPRQATGTGSGSGGPRQQQQAGSSLPLLKPQQPQQGGGRKPIPECMRLPPTEQQRQREAFTKQLLSVLQPTPDMMRAVGSDATLTAGFDDPQVMAAVAEVQRDPAAMRKHASNPKVLRFYQAMSGLVGSKLAQLGGGGGEG